MWSIFPKWPVVLRYQNTHLNYMPRGTWVSMKYLLSLYRSVCSLLFNLCEFVQYDLYSRVRYQFKLLPPASEVWGKVMFSHLSVCPEGGWCYEGWIVLWSGGAVHNRKWHHNTPWTAPPHPLPSQQAGGRHPTGMLSCILSVKAITTQTLPLFCTNIPQQECIPVGCVPAAHWPYAGACFRGGCLLPGRGVCSWGGLLLGGLLPGGSAPGGCLIPGGSAPRGCLLPGVSDPRGVSAPGGLIWGCLFPGGGCLLPGGVWSWGCLLWGGVWSLGGCLLWGVSAPGGWYPNMHWGRHTPPPRGQNHRRL